MRKRTRSLRTQYTHIRTSKAQHRQHSMAPIKFKIEYLRHHLRLLCCFGVREEDLVAPMGTDPSVRGKLAKQYVKRYSLFDASADMMMQLRRQQHHRTTTTNSHGFAPLATKMQ